MTETLVKIEKLTKWFPGEKEPALKSISADLRKGEIIGVVGPDGSGKTTLLRTMAGLLTPTEGSITHPDRDLTGYMPQKFGLYEDLSVDQNLGLYADLCGLKGQEREETFDRLKQFTQLGPFSKRLAGRLSGGMKQKLGLACALLKKPVILVLDEPSAGVDPLSRRELWKIIYTLVDEGITVVWSTSYLDEAKQCDSVIVLHQGELRFYGNPRRKKLIHLFGKMPEPTSLLADLTPTIKKTSKSVISVQSLTKKFDAFTAVDSITFSVKQGEIFGLLGPNGAGKSTTFKMLCGLLKPTSGNMSNMAKDRIGYMAQKCALYGNLNVRQNLEFFAGIYQADPSIIDKMIEIFHLQQYLSTSPDLLPLGYKQRLALACANMHHPEILFLDEPTSGVDPITRAEFWNHMKALVKKNVTIIITTHFLDEAEYCDRIALIYKGKIIDMDTPANLKRKAKVDTLEEAFIQRIEEYENHTH